jgi:hypothetical protein
MSRIDRFTAHNLATDLLKKAGFTLYKVSRVSESCYFHHPARMGLMLRLSAHKSNKGPIGVETTLVNVSFTEHDEKHLLTQTVVKNRVIWAIGYYFLADPKPSKYKRADDAGIQYKECHLLPQL